MLGRYVCSGIFSLSPIEYCCGEHRRADAEAPEPRRPSGRGHGLGQRQPPVAILRLYCKGHAPGPIHYTLGKTVLISGYS